MPAKTHLQNGLLNLCVEQNIKLCKSESLKVSAFIYHHLHSMTSSGLQFEVAY